MEKGRFTGMKAGIAGLGLIGGSLAMALRRRGGLYVTGFDRDEGTVKAAVESGAADRASTDPGPLFEADIIFVALYPEDIIAFIKRHAHRFKKGTLVVDCCGVKQHITQAVQDTARKNGFVFVGGHPMAGTEKNGFHAASEELFDNASFILTPAGDTPQKAIELLSELLTTIGFKQIVITDPRHHDSMIAFTSQLPHMLACAYVQSPRCPHHHGYSAGSYLDISRVAHINPPLWAELFIDNREALCEEIDLLIQNLQRLRDACAAADFQTLAGLLAKARAIKDGADADA